MASLPQEYEHVEQEKSRLSRRSHDFGPRVDVLWNNQALVCIVSPAFFSHSLGVADHICRSHTGCAAFRTFVREKWLM